MKFLRDYINSNLFISYIYLISLNVLMFNAAILQYKYIYYGVFIVLTILIINMLIRKRKDKKEKIKNKNE